MSRKEKILISSYTYLPDIGGVAKCSFTLAHAFIEKGFEVKVVTSTSQKIDFNDTRYEIIRSPSFFTLIKLFFWADITLFSNLSVKLGWPIIFSFLFKSKYGLFHHSSSAFNGKSRTNFIKKIISSKIINNSIHYVNSEYTVVDGREFFSNLPIEITYPIANRNRIPRDVINEFENKKNAIFVGRIELEKGPKYLVDNFTDIKNTLDIDKLFIVGDGSILGLLKKIASPDIVFLGSLPLESVYKAMDECSYVFVPSIWYEPFGIVAVEGLAAGAIVISSNRGGLPEACGDLALLFDFEKENSFKNAIEKAKVNRDLLVSSKESRCVYFEQVRLHLAKFQAERVADIILQSMR